MALVQVSTTASRTNQSIINKTQASFLARSAVEKLLLFNYEDLELGTYEQDLGVEYPGFKEITTITGEFGSPEGKKITVRVEYPEGCVKYSAVRYYTEGVY